MQKSTSFTCSLIYWSTTGNITPPMVANTTPAVIKMIVAKKHFLPLDFSGILSEETNWLFIMQFKPFARELFNTRTVVGNCPVV